MSEAIEKKPLLDDSLLDDGMLDGLDDFDTPKPKNKKRRILIGCLIGVVILGGAAFALSQTVFAAETVEDVKPKEYTVSRGDISVSYESEGTVSVPFSYINPEYQAKLLTLNVSVGDSFHAGDVLATFDDTTLVSAVEAAEESVQSAEKSLEDAESSVATARDNVTTAQTAVTDAESSLTDAVIAVTDAEEDLRQAKVAVTDAENSLKRQEISYQASEVEAESSQLTRQMDIENQKLTIAGVELQIQTLERELAMMREFPDDYSAQELTSKESELTNQQFKLTREQNNLKVLEKQAVLPDSTMLTAEMNLSSARDAIRKAENDVIKKENALEKANTNVARAESTVATKRAAVSEANSKVSRALSDVSRAQEKLTKAQKNLREAEDDLAQATLIASADGVVMGVNGEVGNTVNSVANANSDNSLLTVQLDDKRYQASASIPELDIGSVFVGQQVRVVIEALDELTCEGVVTEISNFATSGGNGVVSYQATVEFTCNDEALRDAMNCTITFITKEVKDVINVRNDAVYNEDGVSYVDVMLADGTVEKRAVETGFSDGTVCEITGGLEAGETVLSQTVTTGGSQKTTSADSGGGFSFDGGNVFIMESGPGMAMPAGGMVRGG